jgi:hypothetical protein
MRRIQRIDKYYCLLDRVSVTSPLSEIIDVAVSHEPLAPLQVARLCRANHRNAPTTVTVELLLLSVPQACGSHGPWGPCIFKAATATAALEQTGRHSSVILCMLACSVRCYASCASLYVCFWWQVLTYAPTVCSSFAGCSTTASCTLTRHSQHPFSAQAPLSGNFWVRCCFVYDVLHTASAWAGRSRNYICTHMAAAVETLQQAWAVPVLGF